jgi:hypothetical protein
MSENPLSIFIFEVKKMKKFFPVLFVLCAFCVAVSAQPAQQPKSGYTIQQ